MVSQAAQTNGDGRRRLVKSLSDGTCQDGFDYDVYDVDDLPPPPPPPQHPIPLYMPMYPEEFQALWQYPKHYCQVMHNGKSSESISSEVIHRCHCHSRSDSEDDVHIISPNSGRRLLTKAISEGEMLQDKRKALEFASGYMEIDLPCDIHREEDVIEPLCVDEGSYTLSDSRIFSQESLVEDTDEDVFHEQFLCSNLSRQSSGERRYSYPSDHELMTFDQEDDLDQRLRDQLDRISPEAIKPQVSMSQLIDHPVNVDHFIEEASPVEGSCLTDSISLLDCDHLEESISESQVTVLQKLPNPSQATDSDNGGLHTDTLPKKKAISQGGSFDEELDEEASRKFTSLLCSSQLSSIDDEQVSISENLATDCSQVTMAAERQDTNMPFDEYYDRVNLTSSKKRDEQLFNKFAYNSEAYETRKLTSPESDSSSSHFTEQETTRSPASTNTNTVTNRSDLSRGDSHPNTDHSETSEDYVTATENSSNYETKEKFLQLDQIIMSSHPRMDDIIENEMLSANIGTTSLTETLVKLVDLDPTVVHHNMNMVCHEAGKGNYSPTQSSFIKEKIRSDTPDIPVSKGNILSRIIETNLSSLALSENFEGRHIKDMSRPLNEQVHTIKDDQHLFIQDKNSNINRRESFSKEERELILSEMKLQFPQGVTMFSGSTCLDEASVINDEKQYRKYTADMRHSTEKSKTKHFNHKNKSSYDNNSKHERSKNQVEASTPGMVRSPAMHEGFRLEDWSIVRTPGTPDPLLDIQSSDESAKDPRTVLRNNRLEKKKDRKKLKENFSHTSEHKPLKIHKEHEKSKEHSADYLLELEEKTKLNSTKAINNRYGQTASVLEVSIPRGGTPTVVGSRRRSGDLMEMSWNQRSTERFQTAGTMGHLLGPEDVLKKAESLRSFSPGSDNVFLGGSNGRSNESLNNFCYQVCNRPGYLVKYHIII